MKITLTISRNISRTIVFLAIIALAAAVPSIALASSLEYPYIYKSPRVMGMGGANVAIGGRFDSVFYNPAGLSNMELDDWEVNILNLSAVYGQNTMDFVEDINDAFDVGDLNGDGDSSDDELIAVNDVLTQYRGKNLHLTVADLSSMARGGDAISWGVGIIASFSMNAVPHQGFGTDGLLEMNTIMDSGVVVGAGFNGEEQFRPGVSAKFINREAMSHEFSARELIENEDNLDSYITDDLLVDASAFGIDAGFIYEMSDAYLAPSIGVSALNIGGMDFGDAGEVPMSLNAGISIRPELPILGDVILGADLVDITGEFDEDSDIGKRLRIGAETSPVDTSLATIAVRAGVYQGYGTFGADLRFTVVTVSYNTYAEELGAYAGQESDRRHMVSLAIGW